MRYLSTRVAAFLLLVILAACNGNGGSVGTQNPSVGTSAPAPSDVRSLAGVDSAQQFSPRRNGQIMIDSGSGVANGTWIADADYNGGGTASSSHAIDTSFISNPAPQGVYHTQRYGTNFTYVIPGLVAHAAYNVRLHFAECFFTAPGQRLFNVKINGTQVLTTFDIFATAGGANIATAKTFAASADGSGNITIELAGSVNYASIAGIEIDGASGSPSPTPSPFRSPTPNPSPTSGGNPPYPSAGWVPYTRSPMSTTVASMYGSNPALEPNSANIINNLWGSNPNDMGVIQMILGGPSYWKSLYGTGTGQKVSESFYMSTSSDPAYTVSCNLYPSSCNNGVVHIPTNALPSDDSDHHLVIRDLATGLDWQFWVATIPSGSGGTFVTGTGNSQPVASSEGIALGGTASNVDTGAWSVRPEDILAGRVPHALAVEATCDVSTNGNQSGAYVYPVLPNPTDGSATDNQFYCGTGYNGQFPNNSPSNVNLEYGAHLWLDVANASIPPVSGSCDAISRAYLRALNEFGAYVTDVGAVGAPIMLLVASDINDTYNGGSSKWQQVFAQISGYGYGEGSAFQFTPTSCGINLQQHLHVLTPPHAN